MSGLPADEERCTVRVHDDFGVSFHRCLNPAKVDGLCGVHLRAKRKAAEREEQWRADSDASDQRRDAAREVAAQLLRDYGIEAAPDYDRVGKGGYTGGIVIQPASVATLLEALA